MEDETPFWSSGEGCPWSEEDLQRMLARRLAHFDGLDYSQGFSTESSGESFDSSAHEIPNLDSSALNSPTRPADLDDGFDVDFRQGHPTEYSGESYDFSAHEPLESELALNLFTLVPDLATPPEQWPDSYTPFTHLTTPNSSNMTCTSSSGCAVSSFGNSSISSEFPCLSPEQPTVTCTPPFSGLLDMMLFDQNIQTDPVRYDAAISPNIMMNAQGLPPEASALKSTPPQQRRCSGPPARERRKIEKPIKCQVCGKGFPYKSDMDRHILANHPERAPEFSVSTLRHTCLLCGATFARKDHKVRHDQRIHDAPKAIRGSRRKA